MVTPANPLAAARLARGWTQGQLAVTSGVSVSQIARIEAGRSVPHPSTVFCLAAALDLDREELQAQLIRQPGAACPECGAALMGEAAYCHLCGEVVR